MNFRLLAALLVLLFTLPSCKKYQEGPYLSFSSKLNRVSGNWYIEEAVSPDGEDSTAVFAGYQFLLEKQDSIAQIFFPGAGGQTDSISGKWFLATNKETFEWVLDSLPENFLFDSAAVFDIYRLTKKDFWMFDKTNNLLKLAPL